MSTVNAFLVQRDSNVKTSVVVDAEYGEINLKQEFTVDRSIYFSFDIDPAIYFVEYDGDRFSIEKSVTGTFFISDVDLDDFKNHVMG